MYMFLVAALFCCCLHSGSSTYGSISISDSGISSIRSLRSTDISTRVIPQASSSTASSSYKICIISWNLAEKSPIDIDFLSSFRSNDIIVFGVQELEDIRPRRTEGRRSRILKKLQKQVLGKSFVCINRSKLGGVQSSVYVRKSIAKKFQDIQVIHVVCGIGNVIVNKAHQHMLDARNADYARIMSVLYEKSRPSFLTSNQVEATHTRRNNKLKRSLSNVVTLESEVSQMISKLNKSPTITVSKLNGMKGTNKRLKFDRKSKDKRRGRGRQISVKEVSCSLPSAPDDDTADDPYCVDIPFDGIIFFGDLNYRLDCPRLEVELLKESMDHLRESSQLLQLTDDLRDDMSRVLEYDQLLKEKCNGNAFEHFAEDEIKFLPTFKYDKGTNNFDTSSKYRSPAWTDRILYKCKSNNHENGHTLLNLLEYTSYDSKYSDHKPVIATFSMNCQ